MSVGIVCCCIARAGQVEVSDAEKELLSVGLGANIKSRNSYLVTSNLLRAPLMYDMYRSRNDNWKIVRTNGVVRIQNLAPGWMKDAYLSVDPKSGSVGLEAELVDSNSDWQMNVSKETPLKGFSFQSLVKGKFNKYYLSVDETKAELELSEKTGTRWDAIVFGLGGFDVNDPNEPPK